MAMIRHIATTYRNTWIAITLIVAVVYLIQTNLDRIVNTLWQAWVGNEVKWRGVTLKFSKAFIVFPDLHFSFFTANNDKSLVVGKYEEGGVAFPEHNYLLLVDTSGSFNSEHLSEGLSKLCTQISCTKYKESALSEGPKPISCISFQGTADILDNREYHVFCRAIGSDIIVEYHGTLKGYGGFEQQHHELIRAVARSIIN